MITIKKRLLIKKIVQYIQYLYRPLYNKCLWLTIFEFFIAKKTKEHVKLN